MEAVLSSATTTAFGRRLKALREARGLSQGKLSRRSKINVNVISRYERGVVAPTIDSFVKIARALKVSADALLFPDGAPTPQEPSNLELWSRFADAERLNKPDQDALIRLIDGMTARTKMIEIVSGNAAG